MDLSQKQTSKNLQRPAKWHLNLRLLPVLVVTLGILYLVTGFKGWLVFFIGTAGAWLLGWLWIISLEHNLWVERKIHLAWATAGESVPEQITLVNRGWFPALWVEITDQSRSLETPLRLVSDVGPHSQRNRNLSHLFKRRGVYTMGPTHLRCGDPLGVYTLTMDDPHSSTILVTPPILSLVQLRIPSGGWSSDERLRQGYVARNISDTGLRNYVAGDSLRRIHWHASAHADTLIVRQQEAATSRDWYIYVDLERDAQAGVGEYSTLELLIVLAASLAVRGLREYRRVGLALAGPKYISLEPSADPSQGWRILRALAMAEMGHHSLEHVIRQSQSIQAATTILITPSIQSSWVAMAERHFQGSNLMALLVDPVDFGSPVGQGKVLSALVHSRIHYARMPGSLLEEAYASAERSGRRRIRSEDSLKRYLQQGRQAWQNMD
jgi:uncharacterized protein (DUF58 family)